VAPAQKPSRKTAAPDSGAKRATPPAKQVARDTARGQGADSTKTAAAPAPAPTPKPQDTTGQPAEAPLIDAYHQPPHDTVSEAVYDGWKQFNLNCARCHGEDALGTTIAPHLILSLKPDGPINTKELFVQTVCAGRPAKGMPSWCALGLDIAKINDIYLYVKGRSDAKISPGRPAVKKEG
jgi:cytochrome c